jgi:hypothetical protein
MENTLAWAWILQNARMICGISAKLSANTGLDKDDFHSELKLRLVERWAEYDNSRSSPSTWVWWQARAVKTHMVYERKRSFQNVELNNDVVGFRRKESVEAFAEVRQIQGIATPDEWKAIVAITEGHTGKRLGEVCGCAPFSARRRVERLRRKLECQQ